MIFQNSDVDYRHFYLEGALNRVESSDQLNQRYLRGAIKTGCRTIVNCVKAAGTTGQDVDSSQSARVQGNGGREQPRLSFVEKVRREHFVISEHCREYFDSCGVLEGKCQTATPDVASVGHNPNKGIKDMSKTLVTLALMCASLQAQVTRALIAPNPQPSVNPVIEWNRTLLVIVRTAGAQPPTIHSTRSFAILHASIFDAVNNIDGTYSPYLVRLTNVSRLASQPAAADQAAHDVLVALYPTFQATLDSELQQDLAKIAEGQDKTDGTAVGQAVAAEILAFRSTDGANVVPPPYSPEKSARETTNSRLLISHPQTSHNGRRSLRLPWHGLMNFVPLLRRR